MSDLKYSLPGTEVITLTGQTVDKLIRAGDGDAALLYLYILSTQGKSTSSEAAIALDKSKGWIASAMAMLSRLGLVHLDDKEDKTYSREGGTSYAAGDSIIREPRDYTEDEVKQVISSGSEFSVVVDETQRKLGKILSPDELLRLYGIYDNLRLPPEVILQLITHCISESRVTGDGRAPSLRYIEKAAYTWEREGVFTLEKSEEYLKNLEIMRSVRGKIKKVLQIRNREFSETEKRYVDGWISMGFEPDAIAIAYDRTVTKTGNLAYPYMDTILKSWHSQNLNTAQKILDKDGVKMKSTTRQNANRSGQKHGEPSREDLERMKHLLDEMKEEEDK